MKIVVGLGNPGARYGGTRHNMGFLAVEEFSRQGRFARAEEACRSLVRRGRLGGDTVLVARPQTYMNRSGEAVTCLIQGSGADPSDLLVVCDDAAIDLGSLRIRPSGSDGGHLGLRSIIESLGTEDFPRLRIGIRSPLLARGDLTEEVLSPFAPEEEKAAEEGISKAAECIRLALERGIQAAMNAYNRRQPSEAGISPAG